MEKVEKILLLAVLGVAVLIIGVMSFLPEDVSAKKKQDLAKGPDGRLKQLIDPRGETNYEYEEANPNEGSGGVARGNEAESGKAGTPESGDPASGRSQQAEPNTGSGQPVVGTGDGSGAGPAAKTGGQEGHAQAETDQGMAPPTSRVAMQYQGDPRYLIYEIQPNDTLGSIAQRICNSVSAVPDIQLVNETLDPQKLRVGTTIVIPKSAIRPATERVPAAAAAGKAAPANTEKAAPKVSTESVLVKGEPYEVKARDSLWGIAQARVGPRKAGAFIRRMRELNPGLTDMIRPGQKLVLPKN